MLMHFGESAEDIEATRQYLFGKYPAALAQEYYNLLLSFVSMGDPNPSYTLGREIDRREAAAQAATAAATAAIAVATTSGKDGEPILAPPSVTVVGTTAPSTSATAPASTVVLAPTGGGAAIPEVLPDTIPRPVTVGTTTPTDSAYTDALKAQADTVLDLDESPISKIPPWLLWGVALGVIGFVVTKRRGSGSLQGYRRKRRKRR